MKKKFTGFTPEAADLLMRYAWPGNIRELKNVIERTMILASEGDIDAACLPEEVRDYDLAKTELSLTDGDFFTEDMLVTLRKLEDDYIHKVLAVTGNNKTQAARILGIHPTSLMRRLKKKPTLN